MKNHYTNNFHKNHYTNNFYKNHHTNIIRINIFVVINQINKHKAKIYNHCVYTQIIIKKVLLIIKIFYNYKKKIFFIPQI